MDAKKAQSNSIKTIVPIKGNLLAKIKNKLQIKEPSIQNTVVNDVINNNNQNSLDPSQIIIKQKPVNSKVIIQKVEKVNLEIGDILGDRSLQRQPLTTSIPTTNIKIEAKNVEKEEKKYEATLLNEKSPDIDSNKNIPQKTVRTSRKPKLVPKIPIRKRGGNPNRVHQQTAVKLETEKNIQPIAMVSEEVPMDKSDGLLIENEIVESSKSSVQAPVKQEDKAEKSITKENEIPVKNEKAEILLPEMNTKEEGNSCKVTALIEELSNEKDDKQDQVDDDDDDMNMDLTESTWLNDISLLLGENRIKEIDQSLKKIPAIVKGNKIQTENVELKLIINHLLGKLQANSVTDTLIMPSTSGFQSNHSANFDFSDMFDSMTEDDFSKDSSFFNENLCNYQTLVENQLEKNVEVRNVISNQKDLNELPNTTEKEICTNTKQNNASTIRKRRGRPLKMLKAKRIKKETCDSDILKSPRESSVESQKFITRSARRSNRIKDSSPESSFEVSKNSVIPFNQKRSLRSSSREKNMLSDDASKGSMKFMKKVTRVQELKNSEFSRSDSSSSDCETEEVKKKRGKKKKQQLLQGKNINNTSSVQSKRSSRIAQKSSKIVGKIRKSASKNILNSDSECETLSNPPELKLNSSLNNFNSKFRSSIIERNDYIKSSSVDKPKNELTSHPKFIELEERLKKIKDNDPTYRTPPTIVTNKRPYLKTSAFKNGNDNTNVIVDSTTKNEPSVSLKNDSNGKTKNGNIKNFMQDLIDKQNEKIKDPSSSSSSSFVVDTFSNTSSPEKELSITKKINNRNRNKSQVADDKTAKEIFKQEELQNSHEKLVMYENILEAIKISDPKHKWRKNSMNDENLEKVEKELKNLQHFRCGNCNYLVTKHMWREHLIKHGGIAWIDKYEHSINIDDWNEAIRRLINILKIYKLEFLRCANCGQEKKSALGHLSHIYTCAQDEETIERRKVKCKFCDERILPYNIQAHRAKCKGLQVIEEQVEQVESDDENEDDECSNNSGNRSKRKAVKKAEKKLKTIVNELKNEDQEDFSEVETSSSAASLHDELSSETEGSSGVESSDIDTVDDNDEDNDDSINASYRKGKPTVADTEELKTSRKLVSAYTESFQKLNITSKTILWTKQIYDNQLSERILTELVPKYKTLAINLSSFLLDIKLKSSSMKFHSLITGEYNFNYHNKRQDNNEWQVLEVGKSYFDKQSSTLFCGGSVSALDWAQTKNHENYLAVACNSNESLQSQMKLEQTYKSCIQIYKMQHLINEKLNSYEDVSQLLYVFSIVDGPIRSIKFHPFLVASDDRIGLLAVSTANQNVIVFSLPCLKSSNENLIVTLEASIICKLSEEIILYQDKYLLQVTTVNWHYRKDQIQLLAAGYLNGFVSIWMIDDDHMKSENQTLSLLPYLVFQPHHEIVTSIDFKTPLESVILMLTASLDRDIKIFEIENGMQQEIASHKANSRSTCAEWCLNWPGYVFGNDNCFVCTGLNYRQPLEFATRNLSLLSSFSAITDLSVNHWLNFFIYVCDSGDVFASNPKQLIHSYPKDRWQYFSNTNLSYTDIIELNEDGEFGIIFNDIKSKTSKRPKNFRIAPTKFSHQLQINSIRFNRNENSHHFYAIGYETGFVRIKHLKNSK